MPLVEFCFNEIRERSLLQANHLEEPCSVHLVKHTLDKFKKIIAIKTL